ncbi:MAG: hypothetical protein RLZZ165_2154 [Bacteroidota bacterium]
MKRIIKTYEKMDAHLQALFLHQYPEAISPGIVLTFQDHTGKRFKGLELLDAENDTLYLVKMDDYLRANFTETEEKEAGGENDGFEREENPDAEREDDFEDDPSFEGIDD